MKAIGTTVSQFGQVRHAGPGSPFIKSTPKGALYSESFCGHNGSCVPQGGIGFERAKFACTNAKQRVEDHFRGVTKMIAMPKGAHREVADIMLTRYACYLIAQNGDRVLADFLPAVTIKAKDLTTEIINHNVKRDQSLQGEPVITSEHVKNNESIRGLLVKSGIYPESLPAE